MTDHAERPADADELPLGQLLFDGDYDPAEVTAALRRAPKLKEQRHSLADAARDIIDEQLTRLVEELLGSTATELLSAGWRMHEQLTSAARRTVAKPGTTETVDLADDAIDVEDRVDVDVTVNGEVVTSIAVAVVVTLRIGRLRAVVGTGRLRSITRGDCTLAAELRVEDTALLQAAPVRLRAAATQNFEPGIELLDPAAAAGR